MKRRDGLTEAARKYAKKRNFESTLMCSHMYGLVQSACAACKALSLALETLSEAQKPPAEPAVGVDPFFPRITITSQVPVVPCTANPTPLKLAAAVVDVQQNGTSRSLCPPPLPGGVSPCCRADQRSLRGPPRHFWGLRSFLRVTGRPKGDSFGRRWPPPLTRTRKVYGTYTLFVAILLKTTNFGRLCT